MSTKVHAILFVSSVKKDDAGLVGISLFVDKYLMSSQIEIPPPVDVLFMKQIVRDCWRTKPDMSASTREGRYKETKEFDIAVILDKFRVDYFENVPFFETSALNQAMRVKIERNKDIERKGNYALFHVGGPVVFSKNNNDVSFSMNEEELEVFQSIICYVLYFFEDTFLIKGEYKKFLQRKEE